MYQVYFRFYGELNDLLPFDKRKVEFRVELPAQSSVKDAVEGRGVPHPEIALLLLNGLVSDWSPVLKSGDRVSAYPQGYNLELEGISPILVHPRRPLCFVLDLHLGKLASHLRMLGFDTLHSKMPTAEHELARIAEEEQRILLTRNRKLLMRKSLKWGRIIRSSDPKEQVVEVLNRFDCIDEVQPFSRCMVCNHPLHLTDGSGYEQRIPERVWDRHLTEGFQFRTCDGCGRVYWQGTHWDSMRSMMNEWGVKAGELLA